jgi:hypothetical protein
VKKRLTRDLNAEQQDPQLPGSQGRLKKAKSPTKTKPEKPKTRHLVASDEDSEMEEEVEDSEVEVDNDDDDDEVDEDNEDDFDLEDDRAEMDLYQHYRKAIEDGTSERNGIQDEGDEETQPSKKSVEYQPFIPCHQLMLLNRTPTRNLW